MTWTTRDTSANGVQFMLNSGDDIFFAPGVTAQTQGLAQAVVTGAASGHHVLVYGSLMTANAGTVVLGFNPATNSGNMVETAVAGSIQSLSEAAAVSMRSNAATILNAGTIGSAGTAIRLTGTMVLPTTVTNTGTIRGDEFGIDNQGTNPLNITNSGLLFARLVAVDASDSADIINNKGRIFGEIRLEGGNDMYNGKTGQLFGKLFAGAGNDTIIGGTRGETFDGGAGNDLIIGGPGKDFMTGGPGNDTFRFLKGDSGNGSRADVITDFDKSGNDRIDVSGLFGPKMSFIGDDAFTKAGQVRINDVRGPDVVVEINTGGSLAADVSIRLSKTSFASMTASDFVL
ncbi:MAG: calcium-binding protein [Rhizobiaceae bacterium]|nr:calcium-binding protein [Rhizobiaceae bacterium]